MLTIAFAALGVVSGQVLSGNVVDRSPSSTCHNVMCSVNAKTEPCYKEIGEDLAKNLNATANFQPGNKISFVTRADAAKFVTWYCGEIESNVQVTCDQIGGEVACP